MTKLSMLGIISGAALLTAVPFSLQWSQNNVTLSLDSAEARIGRPLTATSIAGVSRRVHRRAYRRAAVYAGAAGLGYGLYSGYGYPASSYSYSYPAYGYGYGYPAMGTAASIGRRSMAAIASPARSRSIAPDGTDFCFQANAFERLSWCGQPANRHRITQLSSAKLRT